MYRGLCPAGSHDRPIPCAVLVSFAPHVFGGLRSKNLALSVLFLFALVPLLHRAEETADAGIDFGCCITLRLLAHLLTSEK